MIEQRIFSSTAFFPTLNGAKVGGEGERDAEKLQVTTLPVRSCAAVKMSRSHVEEDRVRRTEYLYLVLPQRIHFLAQYTQLSSEENNTPEGSARQELCTSGQQPIISCPLLPTRTVILPSTSNSRRQVKDCRVCCRLIPSSSSTWPDSTRVSPLRLPRCSVFVLQLPVRFSSVPFALLSLILHSGRKNDGG
jgi:hypothetical protein